MSLDNSVIMLLGFLKNYSKSTYEHSVNVSILSSKFGEYLNLNKKELTDLKTACLLHDIGKIKIPLKILHKPNGLTDEEYETIKKHSKYGYDLLINLGFKNKNVLNMILNHHEKLDGSGYPNHIINIDSLTRILTICDCYDAMRSKRVYKNSSDLEYVFNEFLYNAGTQFDEEYTYMFLDYLNVSHLKRIMK